MKKILLLSFIVFTALSSRAQDPLLPLRLELEDSVAAANSTVYVKFLIHDGDESHVLWTNSTLTPDLDPLYGTPIALLGHTLYVLLGNTSLSNMEALPKDLFAEGSLRKLRIWVSKGEYANYKLLTPDLDLVPAPYALRSEESQGFDAETFAEHTSGIAELKTSVRNANGKIAGLQTVCKGLTNGTLLVESPSSIIAQSIVTGSGGEYVYKTSSPLVGPLSPPTMPRHYDISYVTHFASRFKTKTQANVKSVTLYFKNASEIAPPEAVCVFKKSLEIDVIFYAVSVVTTAFPRCVYTFSNNTNIIPGEYLVGLRKTPLYQTLHPYVCSSYRGDLSCYRYDEPDMGETIFVNPNPNNVRRGALVADRVQGRQRDKLVKRRNAFHQRLQRRDRRLAGGKDGLPSGQERAHRKGRPRPRFFTGADHRFRRHRDRRPDRYGPQAPDKRQLVCRQR